MKSKYLLAALMVAGLAACSKEPPPPPLPDWVITGTAARYAEALRRLTA